MVILAASSPAEDMDITGEHPKARLSFALSRAFVTYRSWRLIVDHNSQNWYGSDQDIRLVAKSSRNNGSNLLKRGDDLLLHTLQAQ